MHGFDALQITERAGGSTIGVKVTPRAKRDEIAGLAEGSLAVRVTAPPVDKKANGAVIALLSRSLGVRAGAFSFLKGEKSRHKVIFIEGLSAAHLLKKLREAGVGEENTAPSEKT
jgi:uncharacterized protein (TIGR00251 family)